MKIECPWCHMRVGAYVPKGGDGSAMRLRSHKNMWGGRCMGSGMLDTQSGNSNSSGAVDDGPTTTPCCEGEAPHAG